MDIKVIKLDCLPRYLIVLTIGKEISKNKACPTGMLIVNTVCLPQILHIADIEIWLISITAVGLYVFSMEGD